MNSKLKERLVVSVWKMWLMNQPFRLLRASARGFGPGAKNALEYLFRRAWHHSFEAERLRWWLVRLLNVRSRR